MGHHHSLSVSCSLKFAFLIRPHCIVVPNEHFIILLSNQDIKSVKRKMSLAIQKPGKETRNSLRVKHFLMVHIIQLNLLIQNLPQINRVRIHARSQHISVLCQLVDFCNVSMQNRIPSGKSRISSKNCKIVLGQSHYISSVQLIRVPSLLLMDFCYVFISFQIQCLWMIKVVKVLLVHYKI